jgi:hypothetical protein
MTSFYNQLKSKKIIRFNPNKFVGDISDCKKTKEKLDKCNNQFTNLYNNIMAKLDLIYKDRERKILNLEQRSDALYDINHKWDKLKAIMDEIVDANLFETWDLSIGERLNENIEFKYIK